MTNHDKKHIIFIIIVIIVITGSSLSIIYINKPSTVPAIKTIMYSDITTASTTELTAVTGTSSTLKASSSTAIFPLDINTADKKDLMQLNGIGNVIAQRIIDYRSSGNYFYSIEDIKNIKGIGNSVFNKIKDNITVDTKALPSPPIQETVTAKALTTPTQATETTAAETISPTITAPHNQSSTTHTTTEISSKRATSIITTEVLIEFPLDINSATADELMHLKGIGQSLANRIITYRETNGDFYSIEEIMNVSGIGEATFNKISALIYVDTSNLPPRVTTFTEKTAPPITTTKIIPIININTATLSDFEMLPKITPQLAQNIATFRDTILGGKFSTIYEILYVNGMTDTIFNSINDYITT